MPNNIHAPIWTSSADERFGLGPYMIVGDMLFAFKEDGELFVYRVGASSMTLLRRQRVMEEGVDAWGPIAYADSYMIVRDSKTIMCLQIFEDIKREK
jgi:outer membrane protein assembly factor BamB